MKDRGWVVARLVSNQRIPLYRITRGRKESKPFRALAPAHTPHTTASDRRSRLILSSKGLQTFQLAGPGFLFLCGKLGYSRSIWSGTLLEGHQSLPSRKTALVVWQSVQSTNKYGTKQKSCSAVYLAALRMQSVDPAPVTPSKTKKLSSGASRRPKAFSTS